MCLGIPMQVQSVDGDIATCRGRGGEGRIDVALVAPVAAGDWLLTFLGAARSRIDAAEAMRIDRALAALEAIEAGGRVDVAEYFADLVGREPELPPHLRGSR
ncbi:MAG: HypC/HybG/HupF family hydrogenase formation chaperone [Proteobacteria bacterium]|nr:HypC/HybG/HupF family hydrogenase formation chaperone [Pseudomonadota bacterium]